MLSMFFLLGNVLKSKIGTYSINHLKIEIISKKKKPPPTDSLIKYTQVSYFNAEKEEAKENQRKYDLI